MIKTNRGKHGGKRADLWIGDGYFIEESDVLLFEILVLAVISCYGGGLSCMPAFLSDLFGVKQLASIHGSILTAWGMAGVAGPFLLSFMKETTGAMRRRFISFLPCSLWLLSYLGSLRGRDGNKKGAVDLTRYFKSKKTLIQSQSQLLQEFLYMASS